MSRPPPHVKRIAAALPATKSALEQRLKLTANEVKYALQWLRNRAFLATTGRCGHHEAINRLSRDLVTVCEEYDRRAGMPMRGAVPVVPAEAVKVFDGDELAKSLGIRRAPLPPGRVIRTVVRA